MEVAMPEKRIALVTGGNRGMGLEVVRQLAARGMMVLLGSRDEKMGEDAQAQLPAADRERVAVCSFDVADSERTAQAMRDIERRHGPVDVLVNNAGVYPDAGVPGLEIDPEIVRSTFETNALGALRLCQLLVPGMVKRGWGRVVNVSSGYGQMRPMGSGVLAYRVSKAALNTMTLIIADEVRGKGVLVNAADPGWVRTRMGGLGAPRSIEEGADTIVWLATLPDDGPTGGFFHDRTLVPW
jgi:NAD(P)-dependent dehydrogenase (short-subunit alcohol dehydrogenase family)